MSRFKSLKIQAINGELNARADGLAKGAAYGEFDRKNNLNLKKFMLKESVEENTQKVKLLML